MKTYVVLIAFVLFSSSAIAVSFDCVKALSSVEKAICTDPLLGKLDDALTENYKGMIASDFGGSKKSLKVEQKSGFQVEINVQTIHA
jgi:uncharacterized protein